LQDGRHAARHERAAERFEESPDRAAIADVINIAEGFINEIDDAREHIASALRPYGERTI
jgi:hypothetical protein